MADEPDETPQTDPSHESVIENSRQRKDERADSVENIMEQVDRHLEGQKFPVRGEELAEEYGGQPGDMPNETESLGSVFDRLAQDEEYESVEEVREAVYGEVTGEAGGENEYNTERELQEIAEDVVDDESNTNVN
ncbi:hypothetical protein AUR64_07325 [Haloprofundus marisrubri]|uniref:DUF2795 domain-containing protein n=1 Tax=Haloprofundus marisrubri TaxID=1514971 RepID=A0A0W1RBB4_9EURY|nr:hypothetical protein [Haloprofundus marisrubri]KTG10974.1 hypothetical protein AUR64_07325 [Haloprofundus marisrubri]